MVPFVARLEEILRSIVQMRYTSNPGQIQAMKFRRHVHAEAHLPVLIRLVASVKANNAVIHFAV
jgi:hypothetical protein